MKLHAILYENRVAHFIHLFVIMFPIQLSFVWSTQFADTSDVIVSISWNMSPWQYPIKLVINHRFWWLNQLCASFSMVKYHKTIIFADKNDEFTHKKPSCLLLSHHFSHHFPHDFPPGFTIRWVKPGDRGPKPWSWCPRRPGATRRTARSSSWTAQVGSDPMLRCFDGGSWWFVGKGNEQNSMVKYHWDITHRIHGAAIYGNMDPINILQMLAYIPYMDPMGNRTAYNSMEIGNESLGYNRTGYVLDHDSRKVNCGKMDPEWWYTRISPKTEVS